MKKIANSIAKAVEGAESMAGFNINKVICNLSGGRPITKIFRNKLKIENGKVEKNDILKLLRFKNHYQIDDYEILSSSVIKYVFTLKFPTVKHSTLIAYSPSMLILFNQCFQKKN